MPRKALLLLTLVAAAGLAVFLFARPQSTPDHGAAAGDGARLTWAPPRLDDPATIRVTDANRELELDEARDYVIEMPPEPLAGGWGLRITGGHNVVLIGGEISVSGQGPEASVGARRGLMLTGQTGTVHVEGLLIGGPDLSEGIDLDQRLGADVQIQNVRVEKIRARDERNFTDNHPDLIQSWAGPEVLRVDRFTGISDYQGIFLRPFEYRPEVPLRYVDLRRVNLLSTPTARHLLWLEEEVPINLTDVWIDPAPGTSVGRAVWPENAAGWRAVRGGRPPGGDFVPAEAVGLGYRSPGYSSDR